MSPTTFKNYIYTHLGFLPLYMVDTNIKCVIRRLQHVCCLLRGSDFDGDITDCSVGYTRHKPSSSFGGSVILPGASTTDYITRPSVSTLDYTSLYPNVLLRLNRYVVDAFKSLNTVDSWINLYELYGYYPQYFHQPLPIIDHPQYDLLINPQKISKPMYESVLKRKHTLKV